jgi:stalled ribosome rescue protein Dom34
LKEQKLKMMEAKRRIGIWMDHSTAHLMEYKTEIIANIIDSEFTHAQKEQSISKSEKLMHNKEQHKQAEFYHKIGQVILNFDEVLLFGPTDAKSELYNILKLDHLFSKIKFEVKDSDNLTENQEHAFVKDYFTTS